MTLVHKVRIYDLARELRQDTKRIMEDARREGVDVSVPSNSIPKEVADKIRNKYIPKKEIGLQRPVKVVKRGLRPETEPVVPPPSAPAPPMAVPKAFQSMKLAPAKVAPQPATKTILRPAKIMRPLTPPPPRVVIPPPPIPKPVIAAQAEAPAEISVVVPVAPPPLVAVEAKAEIQVAPVPAEIPAPPTPQPPAPLEPPPAPVVNEAPEAPVVAPSPEPSAPPEPPPAKPAPPPPVKSVPPTPVAKSPTPAPLTVKPSVAKPPTPAPPTLKPSVVKPSTPASSVVRPLVVKPLTPAPSVRAAPPPALPKPPGVPGARPLGSGARVTQLRLTPEALKAGLKHGERAPVIVAPAPAPAAKPAEPRKERRERKRDRDRRRERESQPQRPPLVGTPGETATPQTVYVPSPDNRARGRNRNKKGGKDIRPLDPRGGGRFFRDNNGPGRALSLEERIAGQIGGPKRANLKEARLVEGSTVKDFAEKLSIKPKDVVSLLLQRGVLATINQPLNQDVAGDLAKRFGYHVTFVPFEEMVAEEEFEELLATDADDVELPRAPVVTVMGHVDHGKTSLLDAIRQANVASGEAGGITQHIGAYSVQVTTHDAPDDKRRVVFLDTPGHEAFTKMRARGAKATDVVVLVVAADDGVMPQTIEAIEHSRAAKVPIVVAINKVDKPEANPERVKQELTGQGLTPVEWGGETEMVEVSAKKKQNLNTLLETILLTADILELKASATRLAHGVVLEAKLDKGRGSVATVLVQQGTLRIQDPFIVGQIFGKVRALYNDRGEPITVVGPATPVEVLGLQGVPHAGDTFQVVSDIQRAQQTAHHRQMLARQTLLAQTTKRGIEALGQAETKELLVVIKADVQGSVEVLKSTLEKLSTEKVSVKVVRSGVGAITESDVLLASATQADSAGSAVVIIGFNARPEVRANELAKQENVEIRLHSVIYKVEEEIRAAMLGLLDAIEQEKILGRAEVRDTFRVPKAGIIAGCMVRDGIIKRTAKARLIRDGIVVWEGNIGSLRRFKEDVGEVRDGFECGIGLENFNDIKVDDHIEAYIIEKVAATEL